MKKINAVFQCIAFLMLILMVLHKIVNQPRQKYHIDIPVFVDPLNSVIYSDYISGSLYYYNHIYSPKIFNASECLKIDIIQFYASKGFKQYIVIDSERMKSLIDLIGDKNFNKLGLVSISGREFDFYEMKDLSKTKKPPC